MVVILKTSITDFFATDKASILGLVGKRLLFYDYYEMMFRNPSHRLVIWAVSLNVHRVLLWQWDKLSWI